jgi:hypothetical protein
MAGRFMNKTLTIVCALVLKLSVVSAYPPVNDAPAFPDNDSVRLPPLPDLTNLIRPVLSATAVYDSLHLNELGLNQKVFRMALNGMEKLRKMGRLSNDKIISIVDFSQPSIQRRLYVIDLENCTLLFNTLVAHGMKSGKENALSFSNKPSSNKSSLGFYVTSKTYNGSNGYSLRLQGCEKGFNDNAAKRAIVVHGADYVNEEYITSQGYIGRSQGCPALPPDLSKPLIDEIKDGSCLFIYHPNSYYLSASRLIK